MNWNEGRTARHTHTNELLLLLVYYPMVAVWIAATMAIWSTEWAKNETKLAYNEPEQVHLNYSSIKIPKIIHSFSLL